LSSFILSNITLLYEAKKQAKAYSSEEVANEATPAEAN